MWRIKKMNMKYAILVSRKSYAVVLNKEYYDASILTLLERILGETDEPDQLDEE